MKKIVKNANALNKHRLLQKGRKLKQGKLKTCSPNEIQLSI